MKIVDVKFSYVRIPLPEPGIRMPEWASGRVGSGSKKNWGFLLSQITTDSGLIGIGYGSATTPKQLEAFWKPFLLGADPFNVEKFAVNFRLANQAGYASASVEVALWDIIGKACRQPIYRLFGGFRDKISVYVATMELKSPLEHAEDAVAYRQQGFRAIKLRANRDDPQEDLLAIKAVRDAIGSDMDIIVDAGQYRAGMAGFPKPIWSRRDAMKMARELEKLDVIWLEDPLSDVDQEGLAELSRQVEIPIAGGRQLTVCLLSESSLERDRMIC